MSVAWADRSPPSVFSVKGGREKRGARESEAPRAGKTCKRGPASPQLPPRVCPPACTHRILRGVRVPLLPLRQRHHYPVSPLSLRPPPQARFTFTATEPIDGHRSGGFHMHLTAPERTSRRWELDMQRLTWKKPQPKMDLIIVFWGLLALAVGGIRCQGVYGKWNGSHVRMTLL